MTGVYKCTEDRGVCSLVSEAGGLRGQWLTDNHQGHNTEDRGGHRDMSPGDRVRPVMREV